MPFKTQVQMNMELMQINQKLENLTWEIKNKNN